MRLALIATLALMGAASPALAQISLSIRLGAYPAMVVIPGYPVYYAPGLDYNYFFYDGLYWVYQDEYWYSSAWYDGPWDTVNPYSVPTFMLQVPVRYYRRPPPYFRGWQGENAPHWGEHWGRSWSQQRPGWDRREQGPAPAPARLPEYQRQFSGNNYPAAAQQRELQKREAAPAPRNAGPLRPAQTQSQSQPPRQEPRPQRQEPRQQPRPQQQQQQQQQPLPQRHEPEPQRRAPEQRGNDRSTDNSKGRDKDQDARDPHNSR